MGLSVRVDRRTLARLSFLIQQDDAQSTYLRVRRDPLGIGKRQPTDRE
jgi:hypothetical protein